LDLVLDLLDLGFLLVEVGLQLVDLALEVFLGGLARIAFVQRALQVDRGNLHLLGAGQRRSQKQRRKQENRSLHSTLLRVRRISFERGYNGAPKENWNTLLRSPFLLSSG